MRKFCQGTEDVPDSARFVEIMTETATSKLSKIKLPSWSFETSGEGTLIELLEVHIPNSGTIEEPICREAR
jgi:hypothetical protein